MTPDQDSHDAPVGASGLTSPQPGSLSQEPMDAPPEQAALLIRDAANQLKDFLAERRRESEELSRRIARIESDLERSRESGGQLRILSIVVAVLGFIVTTALWRAVQQGQKVDAALEQTIGAVKSSGKSSLDGIATLRSDLAEQARTAERVEESVATARQLGDKSLEELAVVRRDLAAQIAAAGRLQTMLDEASKEITGDLAEQSEETEAARKAMLNELKSSIARIEGAIEQRTTELTTQREQAQEATERLQAERQAMIREATRSVSLQLAGLKEILDGLESAEEAEASTEKDEAPAQGEEPKATAKESQTPSSRPAEGKPAASASTAPPSKDKKTPGDGSVEQLGPAAKPADAKASEGEKAEGRTVEKPSPAADRPKGDET
jgi:hypothetical protein